MSVRSFTDSDSSSLPFPPAVYPVPPSLPHSYFSSLPPAFPPPSIWSVESWWSLVDQTDSTIPSGRVVEPRDMYQRNTTTSPSAHRALQATSGSICVSSTNDSYGRRFNPPFSLCSFSRFLCVISCARSRGCPGGELRFFFHLSLSLLFCGEGGYEGLSTRKSKIM